MTDRKNGDKIKEQLKGRRCSAVSPCYYKITAVTATSGAVIFYANDDQRLGDSDRRDQTLLNQIEKKEYVLLLHQHHPLIRKYSSYFPQGANRLFATPLLPVSIISLPCEELNPFRESNFKFHYRLYPIRFTPFMGNIIN